MNWRQAVRYRHCTDCTRLLTPVAEEGSCDVEGVVNGYVLGRPRIESRWWVIFRTGADRSLGPPTTYTMGTGSL